jgi:hypothetical protein
MSLFTQTSHKGPGRHLQIKVWLFSIAAILMLVGMAREIDLLIAAAIVLLAVAFVLRFFEKEDEHEDAADDDDYADDDEPVANELPAPDGGIPTDRRAAVEEPRRPME